MARSTSQFQTIRSEGALLPPDVLRAIASQKVEGTSPESYHLPPGTKLNEAIAHSWSVLQKHWKAFQEFRCRLPQQETGTEVTNQNWLLPLFEELKYGRLVTTKAPEIDDRTYPIERFYGQSPIHLVGCNLPLDRRTKGARGAATASPHSMMQEFLNRSEGSLWGFFSNGLVLRILRDNVSLSRQAYVEFDLEAMMEGEVYADFALLWMLCHQSRVEGDKPQDFWLEKWSQIARQQGTRVLSDLRSGVAKAIEPSGVASSPTHATTGFVSSFKTDNSTNRSITARYCGLSTDCSSSSWPRIAGCCMARMLSQPPATCTTPTTPPAAFGNWPTRSVDQNMPISGTRSLWYSTPWGVRKAARNLACPP